MILGGEFLVVISGCRPARGNLALVNGTLVVFYVVEVIWISLRGLLVGLFRLVGEPSGLQAASRMSAADCAEPKFVADAGSIALPVAVLPGCSVG